MWFEDLLIVNMLDRTVENTARINMTDKDAGSRTEYFFVLHACSLSPWFVMDHSRQPKKPVYNALSEAPPKSLHSILVSDLDLPHYD